MNFLQSEYWRKFQESVGRNTYLITSPQPSPSKGEGDFCFSASIIEHTLPIVGKYFYIPRGPVIPAKAGIQSQKLDSGSEAGMTSLLNLAKKENAGWIRIEPANEEILEEIKNNIESIRPRRTGLKIQKAPHDMQPKEILVMDIAESEEQLLTEMKSKTRYNIRLAEKHGVSIKAVSKLDSGSLQRRAGSAGMTTHLNEFLKLTKIMAERQGIQAHPENYYRKMIEIIPGNILKLYVAEYKGPASTRGDDYSSTRGGKIIAANLVVFYGNTCTYLHGASDDSFRNVMAPFLLQWRQIQDAKKVGCEKYDLGGVKTHSTEHMTHNSWAGITRFKFGFCPSVKPIEFPGSFDIIISRERYKAYRFLQMLKNFLRN